MADLTITASQVLASSDATTLTKTANATVTAGQACYLDTTDKWALAQCDDVADSAVVRGIALHGASAGQPLRCQTGGTITLGAAAAPAVGTVYVLSATAGGIAPLADLTTDDYVTLLGVGISTNRLSLAIKATGVQVP